MSKWECFLLTSSDVRDLLARQLIRDNGWELERTSWLSQLRQLPNGTCELLLKRVPVQLDSVPSESDGRGEDR